MRIADITLSKGSHKSKADGMCIMEAVSFFAKEPFSASPECACPVLTAFMIPLNDTMNDVERQMLKPYIKKLIGTRDGKSQERMAVLLHHSIVNITPHALELAGLKDHADKLRAVKFKDYNAARSAAESAASAAWNAAWSAARSSASVAESAAWNAAWSAAENAARSAARSADENAARSAAENAARSAATSAARSAEKNRAEFWKLALAALDEALEIK